MFFTRDKPNIIILVNIQGHAGLFTVLCDALNGKYYKQAIDNESLYMSTRMAAGLIINNILVLGGIDGISGIFLKEGVMEALAVVLKDVRAEAVHLVSHKLVTEFVNHITNVVDKFEVIVEPLIFSLGRDKVISNNLFSLDAISRLLVYDRMLDLFIEEGLISKLCNIIAKFVEDQENTPLVIQSITILT